MYCMHDALKCYLFITKKNQNRQQSKLVNMVNGNGSLNIIIGHIYMDGIMHKWANPHFDDFEILGVLKALDTSFI